jgi:4-amino-4-deoxy-L-arabinose transferase-like glycosyltransferase
MAVFDYLGWLLLEGGRIYVDGAEQNFPGQIWIQTLSTALFGNHLWSARLLDLLLTVGGAAVLVSLLRAARRDPASFLLIPFYIAMVVATDVWTAGQRDVVGALFLAASAAAYRARVHGRSRRWLAVCAAAMFFAVMIRPTYIVFAPLLVACDLKFGRQDGRRLRHVLADAALVAAVGLVLLGAVLLAGWRSGALAAWYEVAVRFNLEIYSMNLSWGEATWRFLQVLRSWHWYFAFAVGGAWLWWRDGRDRLTWALVLSIAVTSVVSAYIQRKGFGYHLGGLLPVLAVLDVYFIDRALDAVRATRPSRLRVAATVVVCAIAVGGMAKKVWHELRNPIMAYAGRLSERELLARYETGLAGFTVADAVEAAELAASTVSPHETVLTWSRAMHVNFLAQRHSPSRFATVGLLVLARKPFSLADRWTEELAEVFRTRPPELVFAPGEGGGSDYASLWQDADPSGPTRVLRRELTSHYFPERRIGSVIAYRRVKGPP